MLLSCGAHKHVAELMRQWSNVDSNVEHKHKLVACGCILNICADNGKFMYSNCNLSAFSDVFEMFPVLLTEALSKSISDLGVIETLAALCKDTADDGVVDMALKALAAITDSCK